MKVRKVSCDPRLKYLVTPALISSKGKIFLDVACGFGFWGNQIRSYCHSAYLIGLDIWKPYLLSVKHKGIYDDLVLADATKLPFRRKSVDVCCACEIIEHLSKSKGRQFLASLGDISKEKVIVSTPNYRYVQDSVGGNPYAKHVSVWRDLDLKRCGYEVSGIGFQIKEKIIIGRIPGIRKVFGKIISHGKFTKFAELIVAIKNFVTINLH